jgi:DNA-binding response OmpR family regulator
MHKILLIDDDEMQLHLERSILMNAGYDVFATADGPQGIAMLKKNSMDLVLLDLGLPSMSGMEVLKEVRKLGRDSKIIVITGYPSVESSVVAMRFGACDYIQKPIDVPVLLKKISTALATA